MEITEEPMVQYLLRWRKLGCSYMHVVFKVMKADCSTLVGVLAGVDGSNLVYIPKDEISSSIGSLSNVYLDTSGHLQRRDRSVHLPILIDRDFNRMTDYSSVDKVISFMAKNYMYFR